MLLGPEARWFVEVGTRVGAYCIRPTGRHHRWRMCHRGTCIRYGHSGPEARLGGVCRCAPGFRRPGFRPGLWSTGPTARPGTGERPVWAPDHSQGRTPWCVDDRGETPGRGGYPMRSNTGGAGFLRSDRNKCTSSSCFCLRILVRLRGQRSIRKTCVSIRNITYFISPVHMAGMFILQAPYLLPISAVCFPRCSRNPRAVNNPSRRN